MIGGSTFFGGGIVRGGQDNSSSTGKCDRNGASRSENGVDVVIAVSTRGTPSLYRVPRECPSSFDLYMWGER